MRLARLKDLSSLKIKEMNEETIHNLEALGFTNYESKVFCALFEGHTMTGSEIAKDAKIPRSSAYEILKSFVQKGICNEIQTSSVLLYELIDPTVVEDKLGHEIKETARVKLDKLKDSFEKLQPLFKSKKKDEKIDVELIKGFNKHRQLKFLNLLKVSKNEVLLMIRLAINVDKQLDEASLEFYQRGGVTRSIYESSYDFKIKEDGVWRKGTADNLVDLCENWMIQGEQVKLTNRILQNIAIFDRKTVFISLVDPEIPVYNRSDIIVRNENYANAMAEYFESCWNKAETVEEFKKKINH